MTFLSSLLLSAALSGGGAPTPPASLTARTWVLTELAPGGRVRRVSGERPTLTVTSPTITSPNVTSKSGSLTVSGSTGCNTYRGPATLSGQRLKLSALATTRRGCAPAAARLENDFLTLLRGASHYRLSGQTLTVYAGGLSRLVFTAAPAAAPGGSMPTPPRTPATATPPAATPLTAAQLAGDWQLTRLREGGKAVNVPADALLTFTASGTGTLRLSGSAGCNRLMGEATLGGANLTFGPLAGTRMFCEDMAAEQALTRVLRGTGQLAVSGNLLTWRGTGGELELTRRAAVTVAADLGGTYRLLSVSGTPADASRAVRLTFNAGQLGGFNGCNSFGGEYRLDKAGQLTADSLISTLRACPDQTDQPSLTALLGKAPMLRLSGQTLTLEAGGEQWVFEQE